MSSLKKIAAGVALTVSAAGLTSTATAFAETKVSGSGCHVSVADPASAMNVWSVGGRYNGPKGSCQNSTTITGELKRDIPWDSDPIDAKDVKFGVTAYTLPNEPCAAHGHANYYGTTITSSGDSLDGNHIHVC